MLLYHFHLQQQLPGQVAHGETSCWYAQCASPHSGRQLPSSRSLVRGEVPASSLPGLGELCCHVLGGGRALGAAFSVTPDNSHLDCSSLASRFCPPWAGGRPPGIGSSAFLLFPPADVCVPPRMKDYGMALPGSHFGFYQPKTSWWGSSSDWVFITHAVSGSMSWLLQPPLEGPSLGVRVKLWGADTESSGELRAQP